MPKLKYNALFENVKFTLAQNIPYGKQFKSSDLARYVSSYNASDVAYGLCRLNHTGDVRIVGYEPSDKVPAGHLRIYERVNVLGDFVKIGLDIFEDDEKVTKVTQNEEDKVIKTRIDWMRLDTIFPSRMTNVIEEHGMSGVYQVVRTEHKTDDLISPNIGYIGQSRSIFGRVWCLKNNKHNACNYIKHNNIAYSDIWVRFLFTDLENRGRLERLLHDKMKEAYGYTYQWREASGGTDGSMLRLYEMLDKISTREDAESVYAYVRQRCVDLYLENLGNETDKD
jgi:hypothetical protein